MEPGRVSEGSRSEWLEDEEGLTMFGLMTLAFQTVIMAGLTYLLYSKVAWLRKPMVEAQ